MAVLSNNQIQAGIVAFLKSNALITTEVSPNEIKEDQWQGTEYTYPNIRVRLISSLPSGGEKCSQVVEFGIQVFTEEASSLICDRIVGIIASELHEKKFTANGIAFSTIVTNVVPASRSDFRTWRGEALIRARAL